jgi:hypothetical protein
MLPVSLLNVALTAAVYLAAGRDGLAWMGIVEWIAILFFLALSSRAPAGAAEAGGGGGGHSHSSAATH